MEKLKELKKQLETLVECELAKGKEKINAKELGEVVDMIKDLSEAIYHCTITEAMEDPENQYGRDYDYMGKLGYSRNGRMSNRPNMNNRRMGYHYDPEEMYGLHDIPMYKPEYYPVYGYTGQVGGQMGNRDSSNYMSSMNSGSRMGNSRYGYSHDDFMSKMHESDMSDPNMKEKRRELMSERIREVSDMLSDTLEVMSPEEKQMWKQKLNKVINM